MARSVDPIYMWSAVALLAYTGYLYFTGYSAKKRADELDKTTKNLSIQLGELKQDLTETKQKAGQLEFKTKGLTEIIAEKTKAFPWLLSVKSEFEDLLAKREVRFLETKKHPAKKSAEIVAEYRNKTREAQQQLNRVKYRQIYAEKLFPWLSDLLDEDLDQLLTESQSSADIIDDDDSTFDPAQNFLAFEEYSRLSEVARNQLALERYEKKRRTAWEIGREFERYVGYCLEQDGYNVIYFGAVEGLADLGRDIIASRNEETLIVQCKYWRSDRTIHEKHIYQLYGTYCDYVISNNTNPQTRQGQLFGERDALQNVKPMFLTTAQLSDRAKLASGLLQVSAETIPMERWEYPKIKCNISSRDGTRIYHLPFDQQYDRVKIDKSTGEQYALTCAEAELRGFRRAWRWKGTNQS